MRKQTSRNNNSFSQTPPAMETQAISPTGSDTVRFEGMEAVAAIAGQIAHDFNNFLTPLVAYPELIRTDLPEGCRGRILLETIEKTAQNMVDITLQLLAFSRRDSQKWVALEINDVVRHSVVELQSHAECQNIEIVMNLATGLPAVKSSFEQISSVIRCLCQNAVEAVEDSGRIEIRTATVNADRPMGHYKRIDAGEYVKLSVIDNGMGIPDGLKDKIFDPFFTTKKSSKRRGLGLGLSIVSRIVRNCSGFVDFESTTGRGSTFNVYFPIFRKELPKKEPEETEADRGETVLIVDDDPQQREIIAGLFLQHGYRASCLPNCERAMEFMAECAVPAAGKKADSGADRFPDLLILDVIMDQGIDGREACKRILEIHPGQRIIVTSGYLAPEDVDVRQFTGTVTYLDKPLAWKKIDHALQQLAQSGEATPSSNELTPCTANCILIVDDEEGIRRLFQAILASAFPKARIELAGNGAEAVEAFRASHHAVVLMDLRMPVMDGKEAFMEIEALCRKNKWKMPAVVFCTGFVPPGAIKDVVNGRNTHRLLTKPVSGDDLIMTVRERLSGR